MTVTRKSCFTCITASAAPLGQNYKTNCAKARTLCCGPVQFWNELSRTEVSSIAKYSLKFPRTRPTSAVMALQPRQNTAVAPFSFASSQAFEGNDGSWSTFVIRVGTPEQVFHVLISTVSEETWVPVPQGCLPSDPTNCGVLRGVQPFEGQSSSGFQVNEVRSVKDNWMNAHWKLYSLRLGFRLT